MDPPLPPSEGSLKVLIVDAHPGLCRGLSELLATYPGVALVGTASTLERAVELGPELDPDVVLIGLDRVERSSCDLIQRIKRRTEKIRVVVLGLDAVRAPEALACDADDFLIMGCSSDELIEALFGERVGPETLAAGWTESRPCGPSGGRRSKR